MNRNFLKKKKYSGQKVHEKVLSMTDYQEDENQDTMETSQ